jgi:hypothetical protein
MSDDLISQLRNLKAGATVVYHQGWYINGIASPAAAVAMGLSKTGKVHLTQKRLPDGRGFAYMATGATPEHAIMTDIRSRRGRGFHSGGIPGRLR